MLTLASQIKVISDNLLSNSNNIVTCFHCEIKSLFVCFSFPQIKKIELNDERELFCAWISRDPEEEGEGGRSAAGFSLASSFNSTMDNSVMNLGEVGGITFKFQLTKQTNEQEVISVTYSLFLRYAAANRVDSEV